MANLYANVLQLDPDGFDACLDLVTTSAARLMNVDGYGVAIGNPADLVVLDAAGRREALAEVAVPLFAYKKGRRTFRRKRPVIERTHCLK